MVWVAILFCLFNLVVIDVTFVLITSKLLHMLHPDKALKGSAPPLVGRAAFDSLGPLWGPADSASALREYPGLDILFGAEAEAYLNSIEHQPPDFNHATIDDFEDQGVEPTPVQEPEHVRDTV